MTFDGFISYSHAADGRLAPAVQRGLHHLAKPWHRRRALWIFRDQTGLSVTPALWSSIQNALDGSEFFVLLASPEAARSPWVNREIEHWVATKPADRILPVVTDGHWQWDSTLGDFTPDSTAVPDALRDVFAEEPLFLDLRWARDDQHLTLQHSRFRDAIAQLAAPMHGTSKDELEGEDVRQHRRTRRLRSAAAAALAMLTVVASLAGAFAVRNAERATASASEARHQEQVATQQRGTAEQATAEARRQQAKAAEQQARAQNAAAETRRQEKRSRNLQATAGRAAADARRQQEQARRAKADARRQQQLAKRQRALAEQQGAMAKQQGAMAEQQRRLAQQAARETTRQRIIAAKQQRLAEEAAAESERQKAIAQRQQIWAEQATAEALRQEAIARDQERRAQQAAEDASRQQENAARQEQIAVSRRLVNEAKATIRNEPAPALKLALAAQQVQPGDEVGRELAGLITSTRHAGVISDVSYADYGANGILATTDTDFTASLWSVVDRAHPVRLATLDDGAFIGNPTFSPDNGTLALRSVDPDEVVLFDVANPALPVRVGTVSQPDALSMYFSPDGYTLATVDGGGSWQLWDVTDPARPRQLSEQPLDGMFLAFSPDGRTVVTQDQPATIWDITDMTKPTRIGKLGGDWLGHLAFSPRQPILATNDSDYRLVLWDLQDREKPRKIVTLKGPVFMLEFSDDGSTIATNDMFDTTTLWDVADLSEPVQTAELPDDTGFAYSLALSPDGRTLATAGSTGTLTLRNVTSYGEPNNPGLAAGEKKDGRFAALTPDGRRMMTAHSDGTATVWDLSNPVSPQPRTNLRIRPYSLQTAAISPDGNIVASLPAEARMTDLILTDVTDPANPLRLGNVPDVPIVGGLYGGELAFSPDGHTLAVAEVGVMLWDLKDPRHPIQLAYFHEDVVNHHEISVSALAFSPDGRTLAVANERNISLWNVTDRANPVHTGTLKGHLDAVLTMAFSPDGSLLAAGGQDDRASLWNVADGTTPRRLATMTGHVLPIHSVAFAPDGRTLATAASDGTTLLWDVARPAGPVRLATLHRTGRTSPWLLFHPDGHTLLSSAGRGPTHTRALVWDYSALNDLRADPAGHACAVAGGGFTTDEWAASVPELPYRQTCPR